MHLQDKQLYIDNDFLYVQCPVCSTTMHNVINGVAYNSLRCDCCKEEYGITVNRREHVRKNIMTKAKCFCAKRGSFDAVIINLSKGGLKLSISTSAVHVHTLSINDHARITFSTKSIKVEILVQIVNVCGQNSYGCIFMEDFSKKESLQKIVTILQ